MQETANLGLKKPEANEFVDITDLNDNADTIDLAIGGLKPLESNVTMYVATTGSNDEGGGTSEKPFKSIQYALSKLPKNLGSYTATINIANGTYAEAMTISAFYNGYLTITSNTPNAISSSVTINRITVGYCTAMISILGIRFVDTTNTAISIANSLDVYLHYLQIATTSTNTGVYANRSAHVKLYYCDISFRGKAIEFIDSSGYIWECTGASNTIGISALGDTTIKVIGTSPGSINGSVRGDGATFLNRTGTQISQINSSGISCTWGTIQGGYVKNGHDNWAMVTLQFQVTVTTALSANTVYTINGFPTPTGPIAIAVPVHQPSSINWAQINNGSTAVSIRTPTSTGLAVGTTLNFNATYLTNS